MFIIPFLGYFSYMGPIIPISLQLEKAIRVWFVSPIEDISEIYERLLSIIKKGVYKKSELKDCSLIRKENKKDKVLFIIFFVGLFFICGPNNSKKLIEKAMTI